MPRRSNYLEYINPFEEKIKNLQDELNRACRTIISLMPEEIQTTLEDYRSCESREDALIWEAQSTNKIIESAQIIPSGDIFSYSDRAYCPLCGGGANSFDVIGFSVPEGLYRHLVGYGNTRQCRVFDAALKLARGYWHREFSEAEEAKRIAESERTAERRKTDTLYLINSTDEPKLIDEGIYPSDNARDDDGLVWAESRLDDLGFQTKLEANIKSYINEHENFIVYADPGEKGEINFSVFKNPTSKKSRKRIWRNSFYIKDKWKYNLKDKYATRLEQTTENM